MKRSVLVISEISGVFAKTLTADHMNPRRR